MSETLFDVAEFVPVETKGLTVQEAFEAFHEANPWVMSALVALARKATAAGRTRIGVKALFEVLRWETSLRLPAWEWKLNNNYTSRYARLITSTVPDLADVFELRELRTP